MWSSELASCRCGGANPVPSQPRCLILGGEIDEAARRALVRKLGAFARRRDEVHIDLSEVDYCDLAGLRAVVGLATSQRTVVLHGLPRHLRVMLGILGWDATPGLVIGPRLTTLALPPVSQPDRHRSRGRKWLARA
jgi:ABC-type transporter Mla MlaB component